MDFSANDTKHPGMVTNVAGVEKGEVHGVVINETGHVQELERNFSFLSVCSVGIVTGNTWAALGGSIVVALYNGGPPGVIYEFLVVSFFYWCISASIAELASAIPSSSGVYQWASITAGPKYGKICGWFAGCTTGAGHATSAIVWKNWSNQTGWASDGFVFLAGTLNGAFAVGTPDCVSHLAEEIPNPRRNIPKAILAQMVIGFFTALFYMIAIFYSIQSFDDVLANTYTSPLAEVYLQATSSKGGALGLLILIYLPLTCGFFGNFITCGRMLWTLGRDGATPFSGTVGAIHPTHKNPFNATLICGIICTILGCIYVGSITAFNAFVGSFVIFSTLSYIAAILPHLLTKRRYVIPGPFWMPGWIGYVVGGIGCAYIVVFDVIYCFPYAMPVSAASMNYSALIIVVDILTQEGEAKDMIIEVVKQTKPRLGFFAPSMLEEISDTPKGQDAFGKMEYVFCGGAPSARAAGKKINMVTNVQVVIGSTGAGTIPNLLTGAKED
ncbi:hypothetical protein B0A49_03959 [Cryomyces minteri]|uniref:Choline transport protein n=1 Tax=Cryomyces minteri TaxID=331657 RepID=A0A4U0XKN4_9PEZI|nr:hypothetical protein B0A49_03959 [Cryomyces minteri]